MDYFHAFAAGQESDGSDIFDMDSQPDRKTVELIQTGDIDDVSLMKRALIKGDVETVTQLLNKGVDVETRLEFDWTPLMYAVTAAHYEMTKLLLDRGASANSSQEKRTVLMMSCMASASEEKITACVELLLTRNADPNMVDRSGMSCLMMAARDGYNTVINLLVSHGADINMCNSSGYTALSIAVQYNREDVVLKLLQLGADKTIRTASGKSPADLAADFRHFQISRILSTSPNADPAESYTEETLSRFFNNNSSSSRESATKLNEVELLLHGLELSCLDIVAEHDITWSDLVNMDKDDLQKIGIRDQLDQQKVLNAVKLMSLDKMDLDTIGQLGASNLGSEDLQNFLLGVNQQCCYLTEIIQDTISHFPQRSSQLVFSLDPKKEAQAVCKQLIVQTNDLQKEVTCLLNLLCQMAEDSRDGVLVPGSGSGAGSARGGRSLTRIVLSTLASASFILLLYRASGGNVGSLLCRKLL